MGKIIGRETSQHSREKPDYRLSSDNNLISQRDVTNLDSGL